MSETLLTLADAARIMREAVKDKSYRATELGLVVGSYMRQKKWGGAAENTLLSYESVLARFALDHADLTLKDFEPPVGTERLMEFLDARWADASPNTRAHRLAIMRDFFAWCVTTERLYGNPAMTIKAPRRQTLAERRAHTQAEIQQIVAAQPLRDQVCILLMGRLALRRDELRRLKVSDIDLAQGFLRVRGKGGKRAHVPIVYPEVADLLYLHIQGVGRGPDEFLLYPKKNRERMMTPPAVHNWWSRCLERAGVPHFPMHELRHSALEELRRQTGDVVAAFQLARHANLSTTQAYLHPTQDDLIARMRQVRWQVSSSEENPS
jgi:site-specific recombinase XerD